MGCFATCFGKDKPLRRLRRRPVKKRAPCLLDHLQKHESIEDFQVSHLIEEENSEIPKIEDDIENPSLESISDVTKEKANLSERKKVTFDLNVRIYEELPREEEDEEEIEVKNNEGDSDKVKKDRKSCETQSPSDSSSSSLFSYPPSHRYQNCRDSDDEFDEIVSSDESENDYYTDDDEDYEYYYDDIDDDEVDNEVKNDNTKPEMATQEQSSESLFSLSIDSRKHNLKVEAGDKEVNSPMPIKNRPPRDSNRDTRYDQSEYVDSVLNPVENVAQWKVIKARSRQATKDNIGYQAKENLNVGKDFNFPVRKEPLEKEIGVDTSLSSWLVGSGAATPNSKTSSVSVGNSASDRSRFTTSISPSKFDDRPILGALTVEELRQFSATSSPRKSPSRSPDDMPIIGSVGSYWSHTGQTPNSGSSTSTSTKSRSRFTESTEVIWDSTPFETRLEKALEKEGTVAAEQVLRV